MLQASTPLLQHLGIGQVELTHTLARVGKRNTDNRTLPIKDFLARLITDPNGLARHRRLLSLHQIELV